MSSLYLLDTNILLRDTDTTSPQHPTARAALAMLASQSTRLFITPQVLIEFWAVASRPKNANGLDLDTAAIETHLAAYLAVFELAPDIAPIFEQWRRLANAYAPQGKPTHDARLVAVMKAHGLTHFLTFNGAHFARYASGEGITIVDPANAASGALDSRRRQKVIDAMLSVETKEDVIRARELRDEWLELHPGDENVWIASGSLEQSARALGI